MRLLKDLVRFFADAGDMQEAENYFRSLGKVELYNKMLKRLAKMYFEQGKFELSRLLPIVNSSLRMQILQKLQTTKTKSSTHIRR